MRSEIIFILFIEVGVHSGQKVLDSAFAVLDFLEDCGVLSVITLERLDAYLGVGRLARNRFDLGLVLLELLGEVVVFLQDGLDVVKELAVSVESLVALVDGSLELVGDVLLIFLQDHFEASLVSGDNSLALQEQR